MTDDTPELEAATRALPAGWSGTFWPVVGSTQDQARQAAAAGAAGRSVFVADVQTAGRGRRGRAWLASPGMGLLLSVLLREPGPPRPWRATALASVALVEAIERLLPTLAPAIKWPNDVLLDGRKVAGILAEATFDGQQHTAIVGVGVNVHTPAAELAWLGVPATSLAAALEAAQTARRAAPASAGRQTDVGAATADNTVGQAAEPEAAAGGAPGDDAATIAPGAAGATAADGSERRSISRGQLLRALVGRLDDWLGRSEAHLRTAWQARLWGQGQRLRLLDQDGEASVVVLGAEPDGALRVRLADGSIRRTLTGELIL